MTFLIIKLKLCPLQFVCLRIKPLGPMLSTAVAILLQHLNTRQECTSMHRILKLQIDTKWHTHPYTAVLCSMCYMCYKSTSLGCLSCCLKDVGLMNNLVLDISKSYVSTPHVQCEWTIPRWQLHGRVDCNMITSEKPTY